MPDRFQRVGPETRSAIRCRLITAMSPTVTFPAIAMYLSDKVDKECQDLVYLLNIGGTMVLALLTLFFSTACWTSCFVTSLGPCCNYTLICCIASILFYILALLLVSRDDVFGDECWKNPPEGYSWEKRFTEVFWYFCAGLFCLFFSILLLFFGYYWIVRTCFNRESSYSAHYPSILSSRTVSPIRLNVYEPVHELETSWLCPRCSFANDGSVWICQMCDQKKGMPVFPVPHPNLPASAPEKPSANSLINLPRAPSVKRRKRPPPPPPDRKNQERKCSTSSMDADKECKICFENKIDCVLLTCGHMCACSGCAEQLKNCPICREPISQVQRVFSS